MNSRQFNPWFWFRKKTSSTTGSPRDDHADVADNHEGKRVLENLVDHPMVREAAAKLDSVIEDPEGALHDLVKAHPRARSLIGSAAKFIERANKPGGTTHE